jgi:hypothetical protein
MAVCPGRRGVVVAGVTLGPAGDGCAGHPTLTPKSFAMPARPEA